MKFAVTGGAGFIGSNIVKNLIKNGHSVKVIDNLHTGSKKNLNGYLNDIDFCEVDIRNYDELKRNLKNVDGVFHEAALTIVQESYLKRDEYFDVNVKGTENIFNIAKEQNFKIVYASSSSIYGDTKTIPIKEEFPRKPINPYGQTKLEDELLAEKISEENIEWNDYQDLDIKNKWVMVMRNNPERGNLHSLYSSHSSLHKKMLVARDAGAAGIIFISQNT